MTDAAALARLADIELPAAPVSGALPGLMTLLLIIVAVAAAGLAWYRFRTPQRASNTASPSQQALSHISALQRDWEHGAIDDREAAYRLGTLLRRGLDLRQLDDMPAVVEQAAWQRLLQQLAASRYRRPPAPLTRDLFEAASDCLARRATTETARG